MTAPPVLPEDGAPAPGEEKAALDPHKIKALRAALPQVLATSAKNLLLLGYGMTLGFPTLTIPSITAGNNSTDVLQLTKEQISWFSSINLICVPVGCLVSGVITQPVGRKRAMQFVNLPFIAAWLMFYFASSLVELYLALVLSGLAGGLMEAPVLTYVAEITQPHLRGMLSATSSMCVILGIFVQFLLGNFFYWRTVAAINVSFPAVAALALCFVPESPYWLVTKGRVRDAERSLCWLRGWVQPAAVQEELNQLKASLQEQQHQRQASGGDAPKAAEAASRTERPPSWWRAYTKRTFLQPYLLVSVAFFIGHFSGMTTLQTYSVSIFTTLGAPIDKYVATLYLGLSELAGTLVCVALVHWTGKRPLTFVSTLGTGVCFTAVATFAYLHSGGAEGAAADSPYAWLPLTLLLGSAFLSHCGIRLLPWILIGEVYPAAVRGVASGASGSIGYIFSFAANKTYFYMLESLTMHGTFFLYGAIAFVGAVFLFLQLPETEGRTLHEIQQHYAGERDLMNAKRDERRRRRHQQLEETRAAKGLSGSNGTSGPNDVAGPEKFAAVNQALVLDDVESRL